VGVDRAEREQNTRQGHDDAVGDSAAIEALEERLREAERRHSELDDALMDATAENTTLGEQVHRLMGRAEHAERALAERCGEASADTWATLPDPVPRPSEVPAFVRSTLPKVRLPPSACRYLDRLDDALECEVWGRKACEVFIAMQAYAVRPQSFSGDFRDWARTSGDPRAVWLGQRLAMSESDTSRQHPKYRRARTLPIDQRVDESGFRFMESHVQVQRNGGQQIPRIFFHDDTRGLTRLMHVGFYGPHDEIPNASES